MAVVPLKEESIRRKRELLRRCEGILDQLARDEGLSHARIIQDAQGIVPQIPVSAFSVSALGILEIAVKHLREQGYSFTDIGKYLCRDTTTVWIAYRDANQKYPRKLVVKKGIEIPVDVFCNRDYGVLESLVTYLKEQKGLRLSEIAVILSRSPRTIWTVYNRARRKHAA